MSISPDATTVRAFFNIDGAAARAWNLRGHMADAAAANARVRNGHVRVRPVDIDRSQREAAAAQPRPIKRGCSAGKSTLLSVKSCS